MCEIGMNIVKYVNFNDEHHFSTDFGILMAVCVIEVFRVILARRGNLTEKSMYARIITMKVHTNLKIYISDWPVVLAIMLTIPSVLGVVYLMIWQSEVLRFEYIICTIQLGLCVLEIITGILCLFPCCKAPEYY